MRSDILVIKQTDSLKKDIKERNIDVISAYKSTGRYWNLFRRLWKRCHLPFYCIWFNKKLLKKKANTILIYEPLIDIEFVEWLRKKRPACKIIFLYLNVVKTSIKPDRLKKVCQVYSWDKGDCEKYGLNYYRGGYLVPTRKKYKKKKYDVIFIGRDKGRSTFLNELKDKMSEMGLNVFFYVVRDNNRQIFKKKNEESKVLPYDQVVDLSIHSRAILELVQDGQVGTTYRTMEALFYSVKLITNNRDLKAYDFYNKNNIFILGEDPIKKIGEFLDLPYVEIDEKIKYQYTFDAMLESLTGSIKEGKK